jgi:hypothetical protein
VVDREEGEDSGGVSRFEALIVASVERLETAVRCSKGEVKPRGV